MTTYSHSRLETYENSPFRYKLQYIDNIRRGGESIEAAPRLGFENYFDFGQKCLTNYFKRYQPFDQAVTLATELKVNFALDAGGRYRVTGFIDRLDRRADGAYEVHDYKTSASAPDEAKLRTSRQPGFYHLAVTEKFSDADPVELVWHYPATRCHSAAGVRIPISAPRSSISTRSSRCRQTST